MLALIDSKGFFFFLQELSIQQVYRISTMYWDDKYGTHSVSSEVCFTQFLISIDCYYVSKHIHKIVKKLYFLHAH